MTVGPWRRIRWGLIRLRLRLELFASPLWRTELRLPLAGTLRTGRNGRMPTARLMTC